MSAHDVVLFDLDGVLVDSRVAFARSINHALASQGLTPRPERELYRLLGPPLHEALAELLPERSLLQPCVEAYRARYRELGASETAVFDGIRELLEGLSGRLPLLVVTSKPQALAEPLLATLGLRIFFEGVVGPSLESENEPKGVTLARALEELAPSARPLMVGDRRHDVIAAHEHRLRAIGVLWGVGSETELLSAGADELIDSPGELAMRLVPQA